MPSDDFGGRLMTNRSSAGGESSHSPGDGVTRVGVTVVLPDAGATRALGRALAGLLRAGDLVVLAGPLGAGKTVLAQGIGAGLGVAGPVTSPTFVLARVHRGGRLPLVHVDAYRLGSVEEVDDLDLDADLPGSVTVVEWGQGLVEQLADAHLLVRLGRDPAGDERTAELVGSGGDWAQRLERLPGVRADAAGWTPARAAGGRRPPP
jgi:tRNA threonylcarbamoyladenosine biosynthesis protein TsaE